MPRKSINTSSPKDFEPKRKNTISLGSDSNIDNDFKAFKIGDVPTGLEFKLGEIRSTADNFITLNETTEQLTVTKIKGGKSGSVEVPQIIMQHPDATDTSLGLWFNIMTTGTSIIQAGATDTDVVLKASRNLFLYTGETDGDALYVRRGSEWNTGYTTALKLDTFNTDLYIYDKTNENDYLKIDVGAEGATTISTVDADTTVAHLLLDPDGELNLTPATEVKSDAPLKIKEAADAVADTAAYGQLWVKTATPNELYFTTDAGNDIQLTSGTSAAGGGGTSRWHQTIGGYKINNNSTSNYYTIYRFGYDNWSNSDSSPTSLSNYDSYSTAFTAPADGTLTNITVVGQALDTGATDAFKFYVYKAVPPHGSPTSTTATLIGTTSAISTTAVNRIFNVSTDISSSNTFSAGDSLYIWLKKDATSGNQDIYFSVTFSGEYD